MGHFGVEFRRDGELQRGPSPGYWACGVVPGLFAALLAFPTGAVLGIALIFFSAWQAMKRLEGGPSWRSLAWVTVHTALISLVVGLSLLDISTVLVVLLVVAAVLAGPAVASRVTDTRAVGALRPRIRRDA